MFKNSVTFLVGSIVMLAFFAVIMFLVSKTATPLSYLEGLETQEIVMQNQAVTVFIADNPVTQARGLSLIPELPENTGMLFIFSHSHIPKFWMKDMQFALDMIWLDEKGVVVDIHQNVTPETYPETFSPMREVTAVIEVSAGVVDSLEVGVGDVIIFNP